MTISRWLSLSGAIVHVRSDGEMNRASADDTGRFDAASMAGTVVRVRDVAASVRWYREKLGLEPVHVGADGPDHPIAPYVIAGCSIRRLLRERGVEVCEIRRSAHPKFARFRDLDSNRFELSRQSSAGRAAGGSRVA